MVPLFQTSNTNILKAFSQASSGSRGGLDPMASVIILVAVIVVIIVLAIVSKNKGSSSGPSINQLAKTHKLDRDQKKIIKKAIKDYKISNPTMLFSNGRFLNSVLRKLISSIESAGFSPASKESLKGELFEIKRLITINHSAATNTLSNSKSIPTGMEVRLLTKTFPPFATTVSGKTSEYLVLDHPKDGHGDLISFKTGTMVKIRFVRDSDKVYTFVSTISEMREFEGEPKLLVTHSNKVNRVQLRRNMRREFNRSAFFYKVEVIQEGKGRKARSRALVDRNKRYGATFMDISAGGCGIISRSSLPKGSAVMITFDIDHGEPVEVFGRIRSLQKQRNGSILLHVAFTQVNQKLMNRINSFVYGVFEEESNHGRSILNRALVD